MACAARDIEQQMRLERVPAHGRGLGIVVSGGSLSARCFCWSPGQIHCPNVMGSASHE